VVWRDGLIYYNLVTVTLTLTVTIVTIGPRLYTLHSRL